MALRTFKLDDCDRCSVVVEMDTDVLTVERATEINAFWGSAAERLEGSGGDVVLAVVRMFALGAIYELIHDGGGSFSSDVVAAAWSRKLHEEEGWGGANDTPHGWCGLRLTMAEVLLPEGHDFDLAEVQACAPAGA